MLLQEEIEALFVSVRDIILARPSEDISQLASLINSSPRRRRLKELDLEDLHHLLQVWCMPYKTLGWLLTRSSTHFAAFFSMSNQTVLLGMLPATLAHQTQLTTSIQPSRAIMCGLRAQSLHIIK